MQFPIDFGENLKRITFFKCRSVLPPIEGGNSVKMFPPPIRQSTFNAFNAILPQFSAQGGSVLIIFSKTFQFLISSQMWNSYEFFFNV